MVRLLQESLGGQVSSSASSSPQISQLGRLGPEIEAIFFRWQSPLISDPLYLASGIPTLDVYARPAEVAEGAPEQQTKILRV